MMNILTKFLFLSFLFCFSFSQYSANLKGAFSTEQKGEGTYYGLYNKEGGGGTCQLDETSGNPILNSIDVTVALNNVQWSGSEGCGMCLELSGNGEGSGATPIVGTKLAYVNNKCPECAGGDLDLGLSGDGRWHINWKAVPCPTSGGMHVRTEGSHEFYIKVQLTNSKYPIKSMQAKDGDGVFRQLQRQDDNHFTAPGGFKFPFTGDIELKAMSIFDEIVSITVPSGNYPINSGSYATSAQFTQGPGNSPPINSSPINSPPTQAPTNSPPSGSSPTQGGSSTVGLVEGGEVEVLQDWSWGSSNSKASVDSSDVLKVEYTDDYGGLYLSCPGASNCLSNVALVSLSVKAPSGRKFKIVLRQGGNEVGDGFSFTGNGNWMDLSKTLSELGLNPGDFSGLVVQLSETHQNGDTLYIRDLSVVADTSSLQPSSFANALKVSCLFVFMIACGLVLLMI